MLKAAEWSNTWRCSTTRSCPTHLTAPTPHFLPGGPAHPRRDHWNHPLSCSNKGFCGCRCGGRPLDSALGARSESKFPAEPRAAGLIWLSSVNCLIWLSSASLDLAQFCQVWDGRSQGRGRSSRGACRWTVLHLHRQLFFFFVTLVTGPRWSVSLKLRDYEPNASPPRYHTTFPRSDCS